MRTTTIHRSTLAAPRRTARALLLAALALSGAAQAQDTIFEEDFQNRPGPTPIVRVTGYSGVGGTTYSADPPWLTRCNGWVASWSQPATTAAGAGAQVADCLNQVSWNRVQQLSQALGMLNGQTQAQARSNLGVSAYTANNPGANLIEIESSQVPLSDIPVGGTGRFVTFAVDVAAVSCSVSAPLLRFYLLNPLGVETPAGAVVNGCAAPSDVLTEAIGQSGATFVRVGHYRAPGAILYSAGTTLAVRMRNEQGSGGGNDHAFDNLQIIDATPALTKAFATPVLAGQPSRLTFTITNSPDLLQKTGWAFSDNLMTGLRIANPANVSTDCTGTTITAPANGSVITVSNGNLPLNAARCTIALDVFAQDPGNYQNGAGNMTPSVALDMPPSDSHLEVVTNRLTLAKITREGVGAFAMSGNNGVAAQTLTTTAPNQAVAGAAQVLAGTSGTTATTVTETLPTDWFLRGATCTGLAAGVTPTFTAAGTMTIPAAGLVAQAGGRDVTCTLDNVLSSDLSITKRNADPTGGRVERGATTRYTLTVANAGPGTSTNPIVRDAPSAGLICAAANPVTCTGPAGACPAGAATVGDLTGAAGLALGTLAVDASLTLQFDCVVQ